jgi:serine/threonine protein kinase
MRALPENFQSDFNHAHPPHRYKIDADIEEGGQGKVYLGHKLEHPDERVAVKVYNPIAAEMAEPQSEEAQRISALAHGNILKAYWHGTHVHGSGQRSPWRRRNYEPDISHYLVTEYADGGTLKDHVKADQHPEKIVAAIAQVISATAYAHGEGRSAEAIRIVHRDIKPSNVLFLKPETEEPQLPEGFPHLATYGNGKLSDFGVAIYGSGRRIDDETYTVTETQAATGTMPYMPPEQFYGEAGPSSDDYAIGVMAYWSMTGQLPINVDPSPNAQTNIARWARAHQNDIVPSFADVAPTRMNKLYEAWEPVIIRSLGKHPQDRYPSTGDMLEACRIATVSGVEAMKRDAVHIDLGAISDSNQATTDETVPSGGDDAPTKTEQLTGTAETTTQLDAKTETELDLTKKLPEPKLFNRRRVLGGVGVLGLLGGLETINLLNPTTPEDAQSPETRTNEQIATAAAKEILAALEANGMGDRTMMIIKQLGYSDPEFAWQKITDLQKANNPNAPWLAADFTRHSLTDPAKMMNTYKAQKNYDAMAIIAASVAGSTIGSTVPERSDVERSVEDIISFCDDSTALEPHLKIVQAAFTPKLPIKLHAFDRTFTTVRAIFSDLENAGLLWGVNALGRAVAPNDPDEISLLIKHYDQKVQTAADQEVDLYNMLGDLTTALAPYSAPGGGEELANMSSRSTGIADERSQQVALEIARDSTDAVLKYMDTRSASNGSRMAAIALAALAPDKVRQLEATTPEPVKSWINASLNLRDGHTLNAAIQALIADKNVLKNYGPELASALLISHRVG